MVAEQGVNDPAGGPAGGAAQVPAGQEMDPDLQDPLGTFRRDVAAAEAATAAAAAVTAAAAEAATAATEERTGPTAAGS